MRIGSDGAGEGQLRTGRKTVTFQRFAEPLVPFVIGLCITDVPDKADFSAPLLQQMLRNLRNAAAVFHQNQIAVQRGGRNRCGGIQKNLGNGSL